MMEETYLVDNIKEQVCFVSTDLASDLAASRKGTHKLEYVLPDGVDERIGYARKPLAKGEHTEKNAKEQARPSRYLFRDHTDLRSAGKVRPHLQLSAGVPFCWAQAHCIHKASYKPLMHVLLCVAFMHAVIPF